MFKRKSDKPITDAFKEAVKKDKKKEINMKKVISLTVLSTIAVLALFGATFYCGAQFGASQEKKVNERITNEAKSLTASIQVAPSK